MLKIILLLLVVVSSNIFALTKITPSDVFTEVNQIKKEIKIIKDFYKIKKEILYSKLYIELEPRHTWQKTYEITVKINILRTSKNIPRIEPIGMQAILKINPILTYEQTQRILTELAIFKTSMGITKTVTRKDKFKNKTPLDVYNLLNTVSLELDVINGKVFTPSYVFSETLRIYNDISIILNHLNITNGTIPPKRDINSSPADSFNTSMLILKKINKIKKSINIKTTDFEPFRKEFLTPSDVFSLNQIVLSELQIIKAYLGLFEHVTTPAKIHKNKTPTDVNQILGWCLRSINLIKNLDKEIEK